MQGDTNRDCWSVWQANEKLLHAAGWQAESCNARTRKIQRNFPNTGGAPRLCTRYAFAAAATIIDSGGLETPAQVTNISVGGCRLSTNARVSVGASVVIKIQVATDCFEARANVVHRAEDSVGVMFHNESPESLLVLNKWIQQTSEPLRCG